MAYKQERALAVAVAELVAAEQAVLSATPKAIKAAKAACSKAKAVYYAADMAYVHSCDEYVVW